jgi:hypothetical protein
VVVAVTEYPGNHDFEIKGTLICTVPNALGQITGLTVRKGKVLVHTESGIQFIAPVNSIGAKTG